jgi:hypothetical protein
MNQEFNMKKLTALLLGTVISIAFTTDAFAANPVAVAKKYWNSNDGNTGVYVGMTYDQGSIDDVNADYIRPGNNPSTWQLEDGKGGKLEVGADFGKIRVSWRVGAQSSRVKTIDNAVLKAGKADDAAFAYSTANVALDLYRFVLIGEDKAFGGIVPVIALTPYVGGGYGYGGGWMTGKKDSDVLTGSNTKRDAAGHGVVTSYEAGALINVASFVGMTVGYQRLYIQFDDEDVTSNLFNMGVRFTF